MYQADHAHIITIVLLLLVASLSDTMTYLWPAIGCLIHVYTYGTN